MQQGRFFSDDEVPVRGAYGYYGPSGLPPHSNATTSKAAAASVLPHVDTQRGRVLALIRDQGARGATGDEVESALGISHQATGPRLIELRKDDLILDSGMKRPTRAGRQAIVWVARRAGQ